MNVVNSYCTPALAELLFNNQREVDKTGEKKCAEGTLSFYQAFS